MNIKTMKIRAKKLAQNHHLQGALLASSALYLYYKKLGDEGFKFVRPLLGVDSDEFLVEDRHGKVYHVNPELKK